MKFKNKITVFTPTYNRENTLPRLYVSLVNQTYHNFEWVIVDDGSTDNTKNLITKWLAENKITIRYFIQENGGKHRAINRGLDLAQGELFFIVDSDDILPNQSLNNVVNKYEIVKSDPTIGGVIGRKAYFDNSFIGSNTYFEDKITSIFDFRYKMKISGDMSEVFKIDVIKKFPFPEIENEKFCPESLIWNRIGQEYNFLLTSEIFYQAEYQPDGLTSNIFLVRKNSPLAATLFYSELSRMPIPFVQKIRATINYWRFARFVDKPFFIKWKKVNTVYSLIALPISLIFLIKDSK